MLRSTFDFRSVAARPPSDQALGKCSKEAPRSPAVRRGFRGRGQGSVPASSLPASASIGGGAAPWPALPAPPVVGSDPLPPAPPVIGPPGLSLLVDVPALPTAPAKPPLVTLARLGGTRPGPQLGARQPRAAAVPRHLMNERNERAFIADGSLGRRRPRCLRRALPRPPRLDRRQPSPTWRPQSHLRHRPRVRLRRQVVRSRRPRPSRRAPRPRSCRLASTATEEA
jgi:hypothetical protein